MQKVFKCENCNFSVKTDGNIGTKNRNHCPNCLYSKHVDERKPGDREAICGGVMVPTDIVFKKEKEDKYGNKKVGEIMILHECKKCKKTSKNRIAGDDDNGKIMEICKNKENFNEVNKQLYGSSRSES